METKVKQTKGINWNEVMKYTKEIFPKIKSELNTALSNLPLQKSRHHISIDEYPPRISLSFFAEEGFFEKEKELELNQEKISLIISKISERNNLEAKAGTFSTEPRNIGNKGYYCKRFYDFKAGNYTLQVNYKEFTVEQK